ncbi:rhomboid family intramembrane serine protease [Candidatus Poribacteria bacterium]|nr:rhomboid family intramembrane serine protease [Candidatus Poribacteria bacterium]
MGGEIKHRVNAKLTEMEVHTETPPTALGFGIRPRVTKVVNITFLDSSGKTHRFTVEREGESLASEAARWVRGDRGVLVYKTKRGIFGGEKEEFVDFYRGFMLEEDGKLIPISAEDQEAPPPEERAVAGEAVREIESEISTRGKPLITIWIIAINFLIWLAMTGAGGSTKAPVLIKFGAQINSLILKGEYWRLITSMFLHIGLPHFLFNSFFFFMFGRIPELLYGRMRFLAIYILSGYIGNLLFLAFGDPYAISAGASGAIFGILGANIPLRYYLRKNLILTSRFRYLVGIGYVIFIFLRSIGEGVNILAHLGGLISGVTIGFLMVPMSIKTGFRELPSEGSGPSLERGERIEIKALILGGAVVLSTFLCFQIPLMGEKPIQRMINKPIAWKFDPTEIQLYKAAMQVRKNPKEYALHVKRFPGSFTIITRRWKFTYNGKMYRVEENDALIVRDDGFLSNYSADIYRDDLRLILSLSRILHNRGERQWLELVSPDGVRIEKADENGIKSISYKNLSALYGSPPIDRILRIPKGEKLLYMLFDPGRSKLTLAEVVMIDKRDAPSPNEPWTAHWRDNDIDVFYDQTTDKVSRIKFGGVTLESCSVEEALKERKL